MEKIDYDRVKPMSEKEKEEELDLIDYHEHINKESNEENA